MAEIVGDYENNNGITRIRERISALEVHIVRLEEGAESARRAAQTAIDKSESAQHHHNVMSNEWRATLQDVNATKVGVAEFRQLAKEVEKLQMLVGSHQAKDDTTHSALRERLFDVRSWIAVAVSVVSVLIAVSVLFMRMKGA